LRLEVGGLSANEAVVEHAAQRAVKNE
jgi:hypothetical protein